MIAVRGFAKGAAACARRRRSRRVNRSACGRVVDDASIASSTRSSRNSPRRSAGVDEALFHDPADHESALRERAPSTSYETTRDGVPRRRIDEAAGVRALGAHRRKRERAAPRASRPRRAARRRSIAAATRVAPRRPRRGSTRFSAPPRSYSSASHGVRLSYRSRGRVAATPAPSAVWRARAAASRRRRRAHGRRREAARTAGARAPLDLRLDAKRVARTSPSSAVGGNRVAPRRAASTLTYERKAAPHAVASRWFAPAVDARCRTRTRRPGAAIAMSALGGGRSTMVANTPRSASRGMRRVRRLPSTGAGVEIDGGRGRSHGGGGAAVGQGAAGRAPRGVAGPTPVHGSRPSHVTPGAVRGGAPSARATSSGAQVARSERS